MYHNRVTMKSSHGNWELVPWSSRSICLAFKRLQISPGTETTSSLVFPVPGIFFNFYENDPKGGGRNHVAFLPCELGEYVSLQFAKDEKFLGRAARKKREIIPSLSIEERLKVASPRTPVIACRSGALRRAGEMGRTSRSFVRRVQRRKVSVLVRG